jgi:hypothetical protein
MTAKITSSVTEGEEGRENSPRRLILIPTILITLLVLLFFCQLIYLDMFRPKTNEFESLPVSIRAESVADYSKDQSNRVIPPISVNIINQIITEFPATGNPQDRFGTLQADLLTPVPTMTRDRRLTTTLNPTLTHQTFTPMIVISTATQITTPQSTETLFLQPTSTLYIQPTSTNFYFTSTPRPNPTTPPDVLRTKKPTKTPKK